MSDNGYSDKGYLGRSPSMSNNVAEWCGLYNALRSLSDNQSSADRITGDKILIFGDSQLVIRQLNGHWKIKAKHLMQYRVDCINLLEEIGLPWEAKWCPRDENKEADRLADIRNFSQLCGSTA